MFPVELAEYATPFAVNPIASRSCRTCSDRGGIDGVRRNLSQVRQAELLAGVSCLHPLAKGLSSFKPHPRHGLPRVARKRSARLPVHGAVLGVFVHEQLISAQLISPRSRYTPSSMRISPRIRCDSLTAAASWAVWGSSESSPDSSRALSSPRRSSGVCSPSRMQS